MPIRGFIDAFNSNRAATVVPGATITVDEIMSGWEGKELKYHPKGCPHVTKIPRKPVPCGMEGKSSCDGESNIMLRIEIQEGKDAMTEKRYQNRETGGYKFHTAITLRSVEPWFGTNRLVVADSAFASVATAKALLAYGLHFIGIVKTATAGFPKKVFEAWESTNPQRGEMLYLTTKVMVNGTEHKLVAADWKQKWGKK